MTCDDSAEALHQRRIRCYEFESVVPWESIIESMEAQP